jgi:hypothetical protein
MGNSAKATMLEMADYYGKLASTAHRDIAKPAQSNDSWTCPGAVRAVVSAC